MKGLILSGQYTTRLFPLTMTHPIAMLPVGNVPLIGHQIGFMLDCGVTDLIIASAFKSALITEYIDTIFTGSDISIRVMDVALEDDEFSILATQPPQMTFVMHGDVFCQYSRFLDVVKFQQSHGAAYSVMVATCERGTGKGRHVLIDATSPTMAVQQMLFDPKDKRGYPCAGFYIIKGEALTHSNAQNAYNTLANDRKIGYCHLRGECTAITCPHTYLRANFQFLHHLDKQRVVETDGEIAEDVKFEGRVVIGKNVVISPKCTISNAVVMDGTWIGENCTITDSIVAPECTLGRSVAARECTVLGFHSQIHDNTSLRRILIPAGQSAAYITKEPQPWRQLEIAETR